MERGRAWRRTKSECHFLKRIKKQTFYNFVYMFWSSYSLKKYNSKWMDLISSNQVYKYKDVRTCKWQSRNKVKYGKKGKKNFDWSSSQNTRPKDKSRIRKELVDYGY
jgi:hypothetical protein